MVHILYVSRLMEVDDSRNAETLCKAEKRGFARGEGFGSFLLVQARFVASQWPPKDLAPSKVGIEPSGGFHKWGIHRKMDGKNKENPHLEMDDDWGSHMKTETSI